MNTGKKALVILSPGFPGSEADTTCLPMQQRFVLALKKNYPGQQVIVLSFQYPYRRETYTWKGIEVISFNGRNRPGITRLLTRRRVLAALIHIKERYDITGLISFWYGECTWAGKKFACKSGARHFIWILGQDARKGNPYPSVIKAGADQLVALSDFLQDEFTRNYALRPDHVIAAGIDLEQFVMPLPPRDIDIIAAGSLIPLKQFELFIEIVAKLKETIPGIKGVLVGEGPERKKLEALIGKYDLQQTLTLTGELPHEQVLALMQRTKILLHPSSYEGFSGVCLEALQAGARVISFCRPMKREIEHWQVVGEKEEMREKALNLLLDPATPYTAVTVQTMDDVADAFMRLILANE